MLEPSCPVCSNASHRSAKVAPFCSTLHRIKWRNQQEEEFERKLVDAAAQPGQFIDNNGRVCRVRQITTVKNSTNGREVWVSHWLTYCGDTPEYPKALAEGAVVNCLGCIDTPEDEPGE